MSVKEALAWFVAIALFIFGTFERVEKYSSKADLDTYYLMLTIKRDRVGSLWHRAVRRFFDRVFGRGVKLRSFVFPRFSRVLIITGMIHMAIYIFVLCSTALSEGFMFHGISYHGVLAPVAASFISCAPLDYVSFGKTRLLITCASRTTRFALWLLLAITDLICALPLVIVSGFVFIFIYYYIFLSLAHQHPTIFADIFGVTLQLDPDGRINWDHTLEKLTDTGNLLIIMMMNIASSIVSSVVVFAFVGSLLSARALNSISAFQVFLDKHTSVQDKPLQIVGLIAVILFGAVFWGCCAFTRLL
jgi:hypothetical protein